MRLAWAPSGKATTDPLSISISATVTTVVGRLQSNVYGSTPPASIAARMPASVHGQTPASHVTPEPPVPPTLLHRPNHHRLCPQSHCTQQAASARARRHIEIRMSNA